MKANRRDSRQQGSWVSGGSAPTITVGGRYTAARRHVVGGAWLEPLPAAAQSLLPGNVAAATALRILLAHAGLREFSLYEGGSRGAEGNGANY